MTLDDYDHRLLAEIQRDATLPQSELGERVNLSAAAVNRRLKRYRDEGIVRGQVALVEPEQLGHPLTLVVQVEVESERIDLLDAMKRSFARCPQVQQCYYTAGEWDFVLILAVRTMEQYTELTRSLFFESNNVRRFKTLVSMSNVKVGLEIPTGFDAPQGAARS
ncbi:MULTISPECIES: Lrp/AsnC family transcriptional regulator [unclassified Pseudomonas]|uniref:Lrp/AsnC family transcriptional regulator n=1 Tax=unclassified Pseudomonas TaxID=196821 RepID=UPI002306ADAA|nr:MULTISPECIES: Lrp/AsnC family transcriptional regulator [unclassified Pseudomonas]MDU9415762.1 Lrp/AsnC family transcriptional regulator [Pseudomonas sp. zfem005]WCD82071.1 Lrp/AsnC family transcriptional regulator [Pseudomonas sp. TUM22785]